MKNKILKTITKIVAVLFVISICCIDSRSWIPAIICVICLGWLGLLAWANKENETW